MFDLTSARQIKRVHVRRSGQNYDFRYSDATKRFYVSDAIWEELNLANKGFNVQRDSDGNIAFEIVDDNESTYLKARFSKESGEQMGKGKGFTGSVLRPLLDKAGLKGVNNFSLTHIEASSDDAPWYEVSAMNETDDVTSTVTETVEAEDFDTPEAATEDITANDEVLDTEDGEEEAVTVDADEDEEDPFAV